MKFVNPLWLYWISILLIILGGLFWYGPGKRRFLLRRFVAERLLKQLTRVGSRRRAWIKTFCILIATAGIGCALARPQLGVETFERKGRGLDIVFIIDSSKSMLATDLHPGRLERAKLAVLDLMERLESDAIGLVTFAGRAFLQTPPTLDYSAFRESLHSIRPGIITSGGSDIGNALKEAAKAFPIENNVKVAVLLTDGEDLGGNALEAAEAMRKEGIQIFTIGIGTLEGQYLQIKNEQGNREFIRDSNGQPVLSRLDESTLKEIARITGGRYSRLNRTSLNDLYDSVIATLPREELKSELQEIPIERFQWALSIALFFLVLDMGIRPCGKSTFLTVPGLLFLYTAAPSGLEAQEASVADAKELYNEAYQALQDRDFAKATELYENSIALSNDRYLQADALYNLGHTHYQQGRQIYESGNLQSALEQISKAESLFESAGEINHSIETLDQDLERIQQVRKAIETLMESSNSDPSGGTQNSEHPPNEQGSEEKTEPNGTSEATPGREDSPETSTPQEGDGQHEPASEPSVGDNSESEEALNEGQDPEEEMNASAKKSRNPSEASNSNQFGHANEPSDPPDSSEKDASGEVAEIDRSIGGMSEEEATDLLDSLRAKEALLPFINSTGRGTQRDLRDW